MLGWAQPCRSSPSLRIGRRSRVAISWCCTYRPHLTRICSNHSVVTWLRRWPRAKDSFTSMQGTHAKFKSLSQYQGPYLGWAQWHYFLLWEVGTGPIVVNIALTSISNLERPAIAVSCPRPDVGEELCSHHLHYRAQSQHAGGAVYVSAYAYTPVSLPLSISPSIC